MKDINDFLNEQLLVENRDIYRGPVKLKADFTVFGLKEYKDSPEDFEDYKEFVDFCLKNKKWQDDDNIIIPKGTTLKYDGEDAVGRGILTIVDGPAKDMSIAIFPEFIEDIEC